MKKISTLILLSITLIFSLEVFAKGLEKNDIEFFKDKIFEIISLKPIPLNNDSLKELTDANIYELKLTINYSVDTLLVAKTNNKLVDLTKPSTPKDHNGLVKIINPNFKLNNEKNVLILQNALDVLYPISKKEDSRVKTYFKKDGKWYFIRGKFFKNFKGYVFNIKNDGSILKARYELKIPANIVGSR
jgi:hypothetical protein